VLAPTEVEVLGIRVGGVTRRLQALSFAPQSLDRVEVRGSIRRIETEYEADHAREAPGEQDAER
jgi:hypothetical protein